MIKYWKGNLVYFKDDLLTAIKIFSYIVGCIFHGSSAVLDIAYFISNYSEIKNAQYSNPHRT